MTALLLAGMAMAQDEQPVRLSGSFEEFFASAGWGDVYKSRDRFFRLSLNAEFGKWSATASYWDYPYCYWYEIDETNLKYEDNGFSAKIGRFRLPIGLSDWYDQWYSGFVQLPLVEYYFYGASQPLERTNTGIEAEQTLGAHRVQLAITDAEPLYNRVFAKRLDRLSGRYSYYDNGLTVGISGFVDSPGRGSNGTFTALDARYTIPNWILKGEQVWYRGTNQREDGYFVELSHRLKGLTNVTLVGRYEQIRIQEPAEKRMEAWTIGSRIRLPWEITVQANYTGGPDMNRVFFGGGWALGLYKDFRF